MYEHETDTNVIDTNVIEDTNLSSKKEQDDLIIADEHNEQDDLIVVFKKPYKFEGLEYTKVDLTGLENISAKDLTFNEQRLNTGTGQPSAITETTLDYNLGIAAKASGRPIEFFMGLPAREAIRIKYKVTTFLFSPVE